VKHRIQYDDSICRISRRETNIHTENDGEAFSGGLIQLEPEIGGPGKDRQDEPFHHLTVFPVFLFPLPGNAAGFQGHAALLAAPGAFFILDF
jgi:hypothetical protein